MSELLPCPFCGSDSLKIESKTTKVGWTGIEARVESKTFSVRCNKCHSRGGAVGGKVIVSRLDAYKNNMPCWTTTKEDLKGKAIDLWNTRKKESDTE